jgi:hypothetical protein
MPFCLYSAPPESAWQLTVVPLETSCIEFLKDDGQTADSFALESWLSRIAEAMSQFSRTKEIQPASPCDCAAGTINRG